MFGGRHAMRGIPMLLMAAGLLGCGSKGPPATARAQAGPQAGEPEQEEFELHEGLPPKVFKGENGITLEVVYLADRDSVSTALIRFTGIDHPLSGKVLLGTRGGMADSHVWKVRFDGANHIVMQVRMLTNSRDSTFSVALVLPRVDVNLPVTYDKEASEALSPAKMISDHRRHTTSGELARLAAADRDFHIRATADWLRQTTTAIEESCRTKLPTAIDWQGYPDEAIVMRNPCPSALDAVATVCRRDTASRRALLAKVERVVCGYAEKKDMRLGDDKVLHILQPDQKSWDDREEYFALSSLLALTNTVVKDDQGRILSFSPDLDSNGSIYLGDGKTMRRLAPAPGSYNFDSWGPIHNIRLKRSADGWSAGCPGRAIQFLPVDDATRLDVLNSAVFIEEPLWRHREFALARDDRGNYYYVDRDASEFGGQNYRVFRGPRGQVRQVPLTDIVDDSDGKIFATKAGKLRFVLGEDSANSEGEATWIEGKSRTKLVRLPLVGNETLIYTGLGAYDGESLGTICE